MPSPVTPPAGNSWNAPPLLNDDDFADFNSLDQNWFLAAAGETIRNYVGWHIAPSLTQTQLCDLTGDGTILLPSMYVTDVTSVTPPWPGASAISSGSYVVHQGGWISFKPYTYGFAPTPASADLWPIDTTRLFDAYPKHNRRLSVTFTHGYTTLPYPVAEVAYELAMRVMEKPAGVATEVNAGPYHYVFQEFGIVLSEDQKNRLNHYALPSIS